MATDGVKILDSDIANDTYTTIIGLFESGLDKETLLGQFPFKMHDYGFETDYYHELFVTSYALALWEIGWLDENVLTEVQKVISKGASVGVWKEECGISFAKKRQTILNAFEAKITRQNPKPRKRKKYKQSEIAIFEKGDLIVHKQSDRMNRAYLCVDVSVEKGKVWYELTPTSFYGDTSPILEEILNLELYGRRIAVSGDRESVSASQKDVSELWDLFPEESFPIPANAPFIIGLLQEFIKHKDIVPFKNKFHRIGTLNLKEQFNKQGSGSFIYNIEQLEKSPEYFEMMKYYKFPIRILCQT